MDNQERVNELLDEIASLEDYLGNNVLDLRANAYHKYLVTLLKELTKE